MRHFRQIDFSSAAASDSESSRRPHDRNVKEKKWKKKPGPRFNWMANQNARFRRRPPLNEQSTPLFVLFSALLGPSCHRCEMAGKTLLKRTEFCEYDRLRNGRRHRGYLLFAFYSPLYQSFILMRLLLGKRGEITIVTSFFSPLNQTRTFS